MTTISSSDARFAHQAVRSASEEVSSSVSNLVSGKKTDAGVADLSVGTILTTRVNTQKTALGNIGQAKSLLQTAKGAADTVLNLLQQQKSLAVKSSDDSLSDNERGFLDQEFQAIVSEIDRIAGSANFNGKALLDGSISGNAGTATATGLSNEQFSLLEAKDISATGTVASGGLQNSQATVGETTLDFSSADGDGALTFTIDSDGTGTATAQTVSYTEGATGALTAASFVTAANASTDANFNQFSFTDNLDGTVSVKAKEAGAHLNNYTFTTDDADAADLTVGGSNAGASTPVAFSGGTPVTTGAEGIFKSVAANNIVDSAFSGVIDLGDTTAGSGNVNGVKAVRTFEVTGVSANGNSFTFGDVTLNVATTPAAFDTSNTTNDIAIGGSVAGDAAVIVQALSALSAEGTGEAALFDFTLAGAVIVATAKNFGDPTDTDNAEVAISATGGTFAGTLDDAADGAITGVIGAAATGTFTVNDGSGAAIAASTFSVTANTGTAAYTDDQIASQIVAELNAGGAGKIFTFVDNTDGTISYTAKDKDLDINAYSINLADNTTGDINLATAVTGTATTILGADGDLNVAGNTLAATKSVAVADLTFDGGLVGGLTDLQGTFNFDADGNGTNSAVFSVVVNGETYTSQEVFLRADSATSSTSNTIAAGTDLLFQRASGPTDANGAFTNNAFSLNVESDINLATVTNSSTGQASLATVVADLQTQLDSVSINQDRSFSLAQINESSSDHRITAAVGTILEGLQGFDAIGTNRLSHNDGDITLISDQYGDAGTHGDVTSFTVDRLTDTISTTINGETFTAYLNSGNAPTTGGVVAFGTDLDSGTNNGTYSSTTKVLTLGAATGETAKLNFFSDDINDGKVLTIDLGNVAANTAQININSNEGEAALESALNAVFGVSANDSLSFQVGVESSDTIGVSIGSAQSTSLYIDDDGVSQALNIGNITDAIAAGDILDNAINNVVSLIADISAKITSFDSATANANATIQNADAARGKLLDTDYTEESTRFAEAKVLQDAGTALLAQVNSRAANLLQLVQQ